MIKGVLFDFGGTLVQPKISWSQIRERGIEANYKFLQKQGLKKTFREFAETNAAIFKRYQQMEATEDRDIPDQLKYQEMIDQLFPSKPKTQRSRLASEANEVFWEVAARAQTPSRNVYPCLRSLRARGFRMGVISNHHNHRALESMLKRFKMSKYFEVAIASESVGVRKPNPEIFRICLRKLHLARSQTVFVGDSLLYDVAGAKAAGMTSILYVESDPKELKNPRDKEGVMTDPEAEINPDFIIGDLAGLPRIIETLD